MSLSPTDMPHSMRFDKAHALPAMLGLGPHDPSPFHLPAVRPAARQELQNIVSTVSNVSYFYKDESGLNPTEQYGMPCKEVVRICDFTMAGFEIALSLDWHELTECDNGFVVYLARAVNKGQPVVIFEFGCGETLVDGTEATEAQMTAIMKKMGLEVATPAELVTVLLAVAGPYFLSTSSYYRKPFNVEQWYGNTERFMAAGAMLAARESKEGNEKTNEQGDE